MTKLSDIPTDEEIGKRFGIPEFGGVPIVGGYQVVSYRPEDLPHFKPSVEQKYTEEEIADRKAAIKERVLQAFPDLVKDSTAMEVVEEVACEHAEMRSFGIEDFLSKGARFITMFMRPSREISPTLALANALNLPVENVCSKIPALDKELLDTMHEQYHLDPDISKLENAFDIELHCDMSAIDEYGDVNTNDFHACYDVIQNHIAERALAGFFRAKSNYWLAPALKAMVDYEDFEPDFSDCYKSYFELRIRTADKMSGNNRLDGYTSAQIHEALAERNKSGLRVVSDALLEGEIASYEQKIACIRENPKGVFEALHHVAGNPNLDEFSRKNAHQILKAASDLTIGIVPDYIAGVYLKGSNNDGMDVGLE